MNPEPLVSIVIPNFNKGRFISSTLDSVRKQTYANWEAVIIDDGSTDESKEIIESYCRDDMRFSGHFRFKTDNGGAVCRNLGIRLSKGEMIMFLDSDDLLTPTCLSERVARFSSDPDYDLLVFPMGTFYIKPGDNAFVWKTGKKNPLRGFLSHDLPWLITQSFFRRSFIIQNDIRFDESLPRLQDVDFHIQTLKLNPRWRYENTLPNCYYRIDPERIVTEPLRFYELKTDAVIRVARKHLDPGRTGNIKALKMSVLSLLSDLNYARLNGSINIRDFATIGIRAITSTFPSSGILRAYLQVMKAFPFHIRGLRLFFKWLIGVF